MRLAGAKKQTIFLTGINAVVRAMGLLMRMILSRFLGAELMGITELAQSVHMAAIAPLTSGLPAAVSRLTAKAPADRKEESFYAGLRIVRTASFVLIPLLWLSSPWLAKLMGEPRVLPSLWFSAPCVLVLGYSAVYNGFFYGTEQSIYPALSELIEQFTRLIFSLLMLSLFHLLSAPWLAAVPVISTLFAEILGLAFVAFSVKSLHRNKAVQSPAQVRQVIQLAFPTTVSRLFQTLLRSATAVLIPLQLQRSGLSASEATARLGMLNGMVMPMMMLPCVFTSALSMVALPKLVKAEEKPGEMQRLLGLCFAGIFPIALFCAGCIYLLAPFLSNRVYRLAELAPLFQFCAPMTILFTLSHMTGSILSALGQQKRSMYASCLVAIATLVFTCLWAGNPAMRLYGVVLAQYAGQLLTILSSVGLFLLWHRERQIR